MKNNVYEYPHPEWFVGAEKPDIGSIESLVLWGAGKLGEVAAYVLKQRGCDFECFVDSARDKWGKVYCDHKIVSPAEFYEKYSHCAVIVSSSFPVILEDLRKKGIKAYDAHSLFMRVDFGEYKGVYTIEYLGRCITYGLSHYALNQGTGAMIEKLFFVITDYCSLRCLNCDAYIPYMSNPQSDSFELIKNSFEKIVSVCGSVDEINLLGGEPLVHKEINDIVRYFVDSSDCKRVVIISNGTIMPNDELMGLLKSNKCFFRLSDYGRLSRKKEELVSAFEHNDIRYEITNYQHWERVPLIKLPDESADELDKKYIACTSNQLYVKNGKIFHCNFLSGLSTFGDDLFPDMRLNYVDLFGAAEEAANLESVKKYVDHLHSRKHLDACKYCPGSHCMQFEEKLPVAEQTDKTLTVGELYDGGAKICF